MSDLDKLLATAVLGLLGKVVWDWLKGHHGNGKKNNTAGAQNPDFWKNEMEMACDRAIEKKVNPRLVAIESTLARIETAVNRPRGRK